MRHIQGWHLEELGWHLEMMQMCVFGMKIKTVIKACKIKRLKKQAGWCVAHQELKNWVENVFGFFFGDVVCSLVWDWLGDEKRFEIKNNEKPQQWWKCTESSLVRHSVSWKEIKTIFLFSLQKSLREGQFCKNKNISFAFLVWIRFHSLFVRF